MINSCIFGLNNDVDNIIDIFHLNKILKNDRVSIYENSNMRFSFYDTVVRVLLFQNNKHDLKELYKYFYGESDEDDEQN